MPLVPENEDPNEVVPVLLTREQLALLKEDLDDRKARKIVKAWLKEHASWVRNVAMWVSAIIAALISYDWLITYIKRGGS